MNFIYKIPLVRRIYINYLTNWASNNNNAVVEKVIYKKIKMSLVIKDWVQKHIFINGIYEPNESELWFKLSKNCQTIYDIGSNVGYYSLVASKANSNLKIHAFEPINHTYKKLVENVNLNQFDNISAVKKGIANRQQTISLNVGDENNWGMSSINKNEQTSGQTESIECITIDDYTKDNNIGKVDMIKIDIEGSEYNAILGMENTLKNDQPDLFVEILDEHLAPNGKSCTDLYELLWKYGYTAYDVKKERLVHINKPISKNGLIYFTAKKM